MQANSQNIRTEREFEFNDSDFNFLSDLAYKTTGIVLAENKKDMVYGRLARRLRSLNLKSFKQYCEILESGSAADEMGHLINAITTNLTSFFREAHHFEHLRDNVLGNLQKSGTKRLRVWSAACSAGMEPYSIAMTVKAAMGNGAGWDAKILATDIDSNMLNNGIAGEYNAAEYEHIPAAYKQFSSTPTNGKIKMAEELKPLISFKPLNLLEAWPMKGPFDAVFCRNVMIYFDKETKQQLIERIAKLLPIGGWLYIGHSENLHGISDRFELAGRTIYRRVK